MSGSSRSNGRNISAVSPGEMIPICSAGFLSPRFSFPSVANNYLYTVPT